MLNPEQIRELQDAKLQALWREISKSNEFYREKLAGTGFDGRLELLHSLPFTTRAEVEADQAAHPPYGTNLTYAASAYTRLHQTSGSAGHPVRWLDTPESWAWWKQCWAEVYVGAGVTAVDRLFFPFSFGPFVGFWSAFEAAGALGCFCLPAGGMTTRARLHYALDNGVTVVCCTPTYALHMADVAAEEGLDLPGSGVRALIVAGEPGGHIPATRSRIEAAWGARLFDHAGMTEIGAWGFGCMESSDGMHVLETEFIAEVIDPATGAVVPEDGVGERVGELVLTNLGRLGSPLIRYRTGDHVRLMRGKCPCGRSLVQAKGGVLGRIDDMMIIRGNNVFPSAVEDVIRAISEIVEFALVVQKRGAMHDLCLRIELASGADESQVVRTLEDAIRSRFHFRPTVTIAAPGALPRPEMKAKRLIWSESEQDHDD